MESSCVRCRSLEDASNVGGMHEMEDDLPDRAGRPNANAHAGQHDVTNLRHQQAGQHGGEAGRLDVQRVAQGSEGFAGHVWPGQQAFGATLENTGTFNIPRIIYQYYPYYTM